MIQERKIVLASKSPRRRALLEGLGVEYRVLEYDVDEVYPSSLAVEEVPVYLANLKAAACPELIGSNEVLISADTVVVVDGELIGKPKGVKHAVQMLEKLSGKTHQVITGVCLRTGSQKKEISVTTEVAFNAASLDEILYYIEVFKPFDKAGSYGIQDWWGLSKVSSIKGCYYNVMGLPTSRLYDELKAMRVLI